MSREYSLGYCEKRLYDISNEVKLLQARMRFLALEEERGQIAKRRARNRLQMVGRLPREVISSILLFSMMDRGALIWQSPALAVSHHWRDCALNEPMIWRSVQIVADSQQDELVTWLARSRHTPLFVDYNFPSSNCPEEHFTMTQSLIAPHANRIRTLNYRILFPIHFLFPLSMTPPSLESLSVSCTVMEKEWPTSPPTVFGEGLPSRLREIRLDVDSAELVLNDFDASALVTLHVTETITSTSIWPIISQSHLLEDLVWRSVTLEADGPPAISLLDFAPTSLKHLRSATLSGKISLSVLAHLDMPILERLDIEDIPTNSMPTILPHILRHDQLQWLSLCEINPLQTKQLCDIFAGLPQLECFIHDAWTTENIPVLKLLTPPATVKSRGNVGSWCLPRLRVLGITDPFLRDPEPLVQAMDEHIRPLLSRRRLYAFQPLTVVLAPNSLLNGFLGLEGIEWNDNYEYKWSVK